MRRLLIHVFLLGLVSGASCGLVMTACKTVQYHWWLGDNIELFGLRFEGSDGSITYPVVRNNRLLLALTCLGGWLAWGIAAFNRQNQSPLAASAENPPRLRPRAWGLAFVCGCMIALLWATVNLAMSAVLHLLGGYDGLIRLIVLSMAVVLCIDRFRYCWKSPDES